MLQMTRPPAFFLAAALAATVAVAQVQPPGAGAGGPVAVQPIQVPRYDGGTTAERQRAPAPPPAPTQAAPSPPPAPLGSCNAGGCWDSQGRRYDGTGDGSRYISPEGRLCQAHGKFIHCN